MDHDGDVSGSRALGAAMAACRSHLVTAALFSGLVNLLYLAPSIYMLQVYDRAVPTRGTTTLLALTLIFLLSIAVMGLIDWSRSRVLIRASARLDRLLAPPLIAALLRTSVRQPRGSAALRDFDQLRQTLTGGGVLALFDLPWSPIYVGVCFLIHPLLGAMAIAAIAATAGLAWANERATRTPLKLATVAAAHGYASLDGSLGAAGVVRALGMNPAMIARHQAERSEGMVLQAHASMSNASFISATKALRIALQSLALGMGAWLAMDGRISGGAIFAASLLLSRALAPIEQITAASKGLIQAVAARRTLVALLAEAGDQPQPVRLPECRGQLDIEALTIRIAGGEREALADVALSLAPGRILGVVGPSGAGKSTLGRAIVGAVAPDAGTVRIDGAALADWPEDQIGQAIGYVPQEGGLLRGTVRDNIARFRTGDREAIDAEVIRAAQACGAHELILSLPQAYDTPLGWRGTGLSSGQAQRIALARALYGSPALVVLDEPNANLDADGEAELFRTLNKLRERGASVVVIAHRTAVLRAVDELLVLRDGRVAMRGSRDEVLRQLAEPPVVAPAPVTAPRALAA